MEGQGKDLIELRTIQDWMIKPQLRTVPGVAEVNSLGGLEKQGGRPRKIISESYEKLAKLKCPDDPEGRTYGELLAAGQFEAAIQGDTRAAREITDRLEGKAIQAIFGPDRNPITIELLDRFLEEADEEDARPAP